MRCVSSLAHGPARAPRPGPVAALLGRLLAQLDALWGAINQRSILLPAAFVFLWQARRLLGARLACLIFSAVRTGAARGCRCRGVPRRLHAGMLPWRPVALYVDSLRCLDALQPDGGQHNRPIHASVDRLPIFPCYSMRVAHAGMARAMV